MTSIFWLASYPKSGSTWLRAFLANLWAKDEDPVHINDLSIHHIASSRAWMDDVLGFNTADLTRDEIADLRPVVYKWFAAGNGVSSYHKIHDACTRTPSGAWLVSPEATAGALYIVRNPLDIAVSYAHHTGKPIDETITMMADPKHCLSKAGGGALTRQTEQRLLTWSEHVQSWVDHPEISTHAIRYEDMLEDEYAAFKEAATLLALDADADRITKALDGARFKTLQAQEREAPFRERPPTMPQFFRKGIAGDWQKTLTSDQIERIVEDHGPVMARFGYLDSAGQPKVL